MQMILPVILRQAGGCIASKNKRVRTVKKTDVQNNIFEHGCASYLVERGRQMVSLSPFVGYCTASLILFRLPSGEIHASAGSPCAVVVSTSRSR